MPSISQRAVLVIATSLAISACAATAHQKRDPRVVPYNEQVLRLTDSHVAQADLFDSAKLALIERDYIIVDEDPNLGYIEACSPVDFSFGMHTREHWIVFVSTREVTVEKSLQERVKGLWLEYAFVDRSYSYASEAQLLSSIAVAANQFANRSSQDGAEIVANLPPAN